MDNLICIGDRICLFCEDTKGYIAGYNSRYVNKNIYFVCVCVRVFVPELKYCSSAAVTPIKYAQN